MRSPQGRLVAVALVAAAAVIGPESRATPHPPAPAPGPNLSSASDSPVEEGARPAQRTTLSPPRIVSALTSVSRQADGLVYTTRFIVALEDAARFEGGAIRFAHPLPSGASVVETPSVRASVVEGDTLGIVVTPEALVGRAVTIRVHQPSPPGGRFFLAAPIADGHAVQIVDGALDREQVRLADGIFERHVGFTGTRSVDEASRIEARRLTGYAVRLTGTPIYLRGDDLREAPQISATLVSDRARLRTTYVAVAGVFVALAISLVVAARRLSRAASLERADAILASACEEAG